MFIETKAKHNYLTHIHKSCLGIVLKHMFSISAQQFSEKLSIFFSNTFKYLNFPKFATNNFPTHVFSVFSNSIFHRFPSFCRPNLLEATQFSFFFPQFEIFRLCFFRVRWKCSSICFVFFPIFLIKLFFTYFRFFYLKKMALFISQNKIFFKIFQRLRVRNLLLNYR